MDSSIPVGGPGFTRKQVDQTRGRKPLNSTSPCPLHHLLPSGSYPVEVPVLIVLFPFVMNSDVEV